MNNKPTNSWRKKIHEIIYEADTFTGKLFDLILFLSITISVILVALESVDYYDTKYHSFLNISEWIITVLFSIEYLLRIVSVKKPLKYIFSFYGVIDLLSIIPKYISLFIVGANSIAALRALRLMRIFKILKMNRFIGASTNFRRLLLVGKAKIVVFILFVIIFSVISGTIMYLIEGNVNEGFENIPKSIYWAIVTLTTVGYGDIAPSTTVGQVFSSFVMILGYSIIAIGIVTSNMTLAQRKELKLNTQSCSNCLEDKHADNAEFCSKCGESLADG
ncbi:ion transporter [Flavobacteriaceae bacterium]|nr:ion transporter [Flavobacteriaceae bacterium]